MNKIAITFLAALVLTACGSKADDSSNNAKKDGRDPAEVVYGRLKEERLR